MMSDMLSTTFHALADPVRRDILARLALGEETPGELAKPYPMTLSAVSKHLKIMETAGLISRRRESQKRPCKLELAPLQQVDEYLKNYRRMWEESLDQLEVYVQQLREEEQRHEPTTDSD